MLYCTFPNRVLQYQPFLKSCFTVLTLSQTILYNIKAFPNRALPYQRLPKPCFTVPKYSQTMLYRTNAFSNRVDRTRCEVYRTKALPNCVLTYQHVPKPCFIIPKSSQTVHYRPNHSQSVLYRNASETVRYCKKPSQTVLYRTNAFPSHHLPYQSIPKPCFTVPKSSQTMTILTQSYIHRLVQNYICRSIAVIHCRQADISNVCMLVLYCFKCVFQYPEGRERGTRCEIEAHNNTSVYLIAHEARCRTR